MIGLERYYISYLNRVKIESMRFVFLFLFLIPVSNHAQPFSPDEISSWEQKAKNVTIIRDNWGIPHIYGKTDADAVFGLLFAQCEDDFKRVEMNYIEKLGRMAEIKGESSLFDDLFIRMLIDSAEEVADYRQAPDWFRALLDAHAAGINYYLFKHPEEKPALLHRFKPWYPLLWTDGSIGAINTGDITEQDVEALYGEGTKLLATARPPKEESADGSNGFAIGPSRSTSGKSILFINPHVTFYFRPEVQMQSEEGLQAYGAVTWGQFFIYQGFNAHSGWMHTSSNADLADLYLEKIDNRNGKYVDTYENKEIPVTEKRILIRYRKGDEILSREFLAMSTHHGPVMARRNGSYISVRSYNRSLNSLMQSWLRTRAKGFDDFKKTMDMRGNTSNNTVFADYKGNIAYWHGNYMPVRDQKYNWSKPVDGSIEATEWKGLHPVDETVHLYNPSTGWIQNCNSTPFTAAGESSPKKELFPFYMAPDGENFRGVNASRVLSREKQFTIDKVIAAGYDTYLPAFEVLVPALLKAYAQENSRRDTAYTRLAGPVNELKNWDYHTSAGSVATTIAIEWAENLAPQIQKVYIDEGDFDQVTQTKLFASQAKPADLLPSLQLAMDRLEKKFGSWKIPWGELNRYQRLTGDLKESYDDGKPSLPVGFASSTWGCLPSFVSRYMAGTRKRYGVSGNSFVCAVEFGDRILAKSLLAGGESGRLDSRHFQDQAQMYTEGRFKDVLFYKEDVLKHAEKTYHPGEDTQSK